MPDESPSSKITAIGVGVATFRVLKLLKDMFNSNVRTIVVGYDDSALMKGEAGIKLKIGRVLKGLGSCPNPERGKSFAESSKDEIRGAIENSDAIFLMGYASDDFVAGALPEIARYSRDKSKLVISLLRYPFDAEGEKRKEFAEYCIRNSREHSDADIVLRVQNIPRLIGRAPLDLVLEISDILSLNILSSLILPFVEKNDDQRAEVIETFNNSAIGEPAIGDSDKPGNEGISEAVSEALNKRLTDLDYSKAEKIYCNVFLRKEALNYDLEGAKYNIRKFFSQSNIPIHFSFSERMESEVTAVFLIMNAPRRIPTIGELGMDVIN
jgi:cell division protein FtsZ